MFSNSGPELAAGTCSSLTRNLGGGLDPVSLYAALAGGRVDTLILESADRSTSHGARSLVAWGSAVRCICRERTVQVVALNANGASLLSWLASQFPDGRLEEADTFTVSFPAVPEGNEETRRLAPSPVDVLRQLTSGLQVVAGAPDQGPRVAGVFAYDFLGVYETLPPACQDEQNFPDFEFWLPDRMIWFDHQRQNATAVALVIGGENARQAHQDAVVAISRMAEIAAKQEQLPEPGEIPGAPFPVTMEMTDAEYEAIVLRMKEHIVAGDVIQAVPSRTFSVACPEPFLAYRRLRKLNPSPYMFFIHGCSGILFGASPETAVAQRSGGRIEIRPIAGTRPRALQADQTIDLDRDNRLEADLLLDRKEIAEHMMLVDLARNDVARVSVPGTRRVDRLLTVERYSHVMHLVSYVSGQLRPDLDGLAAYVATMNMGTLVGAPKIRAAQLLREMEKSRRGPYGGAVAMVDGSGLLTSCIVIRSAFVQNGQAHVRAGAGIVQDSQPASEAAETRRKAAAVLAALQGSC